MQKIIPYIEGDGIGKDITPVMLKVVDAAVKKAYKGKRSIDWLNVRAGEKAGLPKKTIATIKKHGIAIKGPLTTPKGKGRRSYTVQLRQELDLYACVRPVQWIKGVPSPMKRPQDVNMVVFRENTEDLYAGIDWNHKSGKGAKKIRWLLNGLKHKYREDYERIRFTQNVGIGIKPVSEEGSKRLIKAAMDHATSHKRKRVTLVGKSNIMKYTEGMFVKTGYSIAKQYKQLEVNDVITDAFLQHILTKPKTFDIIATTNLNGDYISDALAAQVGGLGMAPGANINYQTGNAIFEAVHGTAPSHAGKDDVNPCSLLLSAAMMLEYIEWQRAARLIRDSVAKTIRSKHVTYDLARNMPGSRTVSTSRFGDLVIKNL